MMSNLGKLQVLPADSSAAVGDMHREP
jgi:hypothetical protein